MQPPCTSPELGIVQPCPGIVQPCPGIVAVPWCWSLRDALWEFPGGTPRIQGWRANRANPAWRSLFNKNLIFPALPSDRAEISLSWLSPIPAPKAPLPGLRFKALLAALCRMGLRQNPPWEESRAHERGLRTLWGYRRAGEGLWARARSDGMREKAFKVKKCKFKLDFGKKPFPLRVAQRSCRCQRG